jgi:hypothetical protein
MKKTFAALTLATIMMFGSTVGFAEGIIISDAANPQPCTETERDGIIIFSLNDGIIIFGVTVIGGSDSETCKDGIIITD